MPRNIRFSIWFSLIILAAFAAGYSAWAKATLNWPFDKVFYPYPEKHKQTSNSTTSETATWQNCRNELYGYEFKYPRGWHFWKMGPGEYAESTAQDCTGMWQTLSPNIYRSVQSFTFYAGENLSSTIYAGAQTIDEYVSKNPLSKAKFEKPVVRKYGELNGEKVAWWETGDDSSNLILFHNGVKYEISFYGVELELLNKILSTFKFIDSIDSIPCGIMGPSGAISCPVGYYCKMANPPKGVDAPGVCTKK